jgi:hypothetical protein
MRIANFEKEQLKNLKQNLGKPRLTKDAVSAEGRTVPKPF